MAVAQGFKVGEQLSSIGTVRDQLGSGHTFTPHLDQAGQPFATVGNEDELLIVATGRQGLPQHSAYDRGRGAWRCPVCWRVT